MLWISIERSAGKCFCKQRNLIIYIYIYIYIYRVSPKKYSGLILNTSEASEAITLKCTLLDRGKANLDFDILQLYIYKKLTEILVFKFCSIFLDVSKICEKTAY